jgi:aspartate/methionine/tyrosine aminotransferase
MLEVCSTSLPQYSIPLIMGDPRYIDHLTARKLMFEQRVNEAWDILSRVEGIYVTKPHGAFYMPVLFEEGVLNDRQKLPIKDKRVREFVEQKVRDVEPDKRFVYYLLAATGICVVPLTGFCCKKRGFRVTLLECDDEKRLWTWNTIAKSIQTYLGSCD